MYLSLQEILRPDRLEACLDLLGGDDTAVLAGGTRLNATCPDRIIRLVDLQGLPLHTIERDDDKLLLGALVRLTAVAAGAFDVGHNALVQAAQAEANLPIANQSTVGGRIARQRSDGRMWTALLALNARVEVATAGAQPIWLPLAQLAAADLSASILTTVEVPTAAASAYTVFSQTAVDTPVADAAVARLADGTWRLASGGHGVDATGVLLLTDAAALLVDAAAETAGLTPGWRDALRKAVIDALPAYTDVRAGGDYRDAVAATLVVRAVDSLLGQEVKR